jgi:hypothetical protein
MLLLSFHPVVQFCAIVLVFYVADLGFQRTLSLHFGKPARFNRERHAVMGTLALLTLLGGIAGGMIMVSLYLHKPILTGIHGKGAMVALPFLLFGLASGLYLYRKPQPRKLLPALHAINNLLVCLFVLLQLYTGIKQYLYYLSVVG